MAEEQTRIVVNINGESYKLVGDESPEYLQYLSEYVDEKLKQVIIRNPKLPIQKATVLAALIIADDLKKLQEDYDNLVKIMESDIQE